MSLVFGLVVGLADNKIPVEFDNTIETCIEAEVLWEQLRLSMKNSGDSWLWPTDLSDVVGSGMQPGSMISVTYKSLWFNSTYTYSLSEIIENQQFVYTAVEEEHPFVGGARVSIEADGEFRRFMWVGKYLTEPGDWVERRFFNRYSQRFFAALEENIREKEKSSESCQIQAAN